MSQVKHFAVYYGAGGSSTDIQDQAFHEMLLTPYELALKEGGASSVMCSYQRFRDASPYLNKTIDSLAQPSPFPGGLSKTWPLNESHYACENPLLLTYVLRNIWKSNAFLASDYGGVHSSVGFLQGDDREDPGETYLDGTNPEGSDGGRDLGLDPSSSTCADPSGKKVACGEPGVAHVAGIPGPECPATGCSIANAVANGTLPLAVFTRLWPECFTKKSDSAFWAVTIRPRAARIPAVSVRIEAAWLLFRTGRATGRRNWGPGMAMPPSRRKSPRRVRSSSRTTREPCRSPPMT